MAPAGNHSSNTPMTDDEKYEKPWKIEGYRELGKLMASDDDFFLFRRFETLNAGTILYLQHRISELEKGLGAIHMRVQEEENGMNSSFKWDKSEQPDRLQIMNELSCLLLHYSKY
jgi:hypothetical protein